jgi:hypothetical protein
VRTHVQLGARIVEVAPCSMVVAGTIAEWTRWTGLSPTASGPAIVPGALSPIHVSLEQDHAVYVEPNFMGTPPARLSPFVAVPFSPGLQHVDDAACDHVAGFGGVGSHVR